MNDLLSGGLCIWGLIKHDLVNDQGLSSQIGKVNLDKSNTKYSKGIYYGSTTKSMIHQNIKAKHILRFDLIEALPNRIHLRTKPLYMSTCGNLTYQNKDKVRCSTLLKHHQEYCKSRINSYYLDTRIITSNSVHRHKILVAQQVDHNKSSALVNLGTN